MQYATMKQGADERKPNDMVCENSSTAVSRQRGRAGGIGGLMGKGGLAIERGDGWSAASIAGRLRVVVSAVGGRVGQWEVESVEAQGSDCRARSWMRLGVLLGCGCCLLVN